MEPQQDLDLVQQRYKYFIDQNTDEGHFDVTFQFGESLQLHAHSFILWPTSKVFENTLFGPLAHKGPIPIIRHSYSDFKEFLTFLYLSSCKIDMDNVMALVDLAEYYNIKLLKNKCDAFLTKNSTKAENVLKVYESLKIYSLDGAMAKVMEFVAQNTSQILKSEEFLKVKKETILDIVKMESSKAKQEEVFEAICKWAEHNCQDDTVNKQEFLKQQLEDVMPLINFSSMNIKFLNDFVVRKGFLFHSYDNLADALCEATKNQGMASDRLNLISKRKRLQFTDSSGKKAYADICDDTVSTALEKMIANNSLQLNYLNGYVYQSNAHIGYPENRSNKYFLVRDYTGYLSIKTKYTGFDYSINHNDEIIAPIYVPNGSFNLDQQCKIELY